MLYSISSDDCACYYNIEILNLFDAELRLINTKLVMKNTLKELLGELKKYKVQTISVFYQFLILNQSVNLFIRVVN